MPTFPDDVEEVPHALRVSFYKNEGLARCPSSLEHVILSLEFIERGSLLDVPSLVRNWIAVLFQKHQV